MKDNITEINKGLYSDTSNINQPKGFHRFALNAVMESEQGDIGFIGNEESNKFILSFKNHIVGYHYMTDEEVAILSITPDNLSEIGIFNTKTEKYESHVIHDLGFTKEHQFDITFRVRRGCERVIYFTDNNTRPMSYNFDKPDIFKNENGIFQRDRFYMQKSYNRIPMFRSVEVIEGVGSLKTGAYYIAIQYLDEDLNPTEFANVSNRINIYKDNTTDNYADIGGSSSINTGYYTDEITDKALKIVLFNLDPTYRFYRIALVKYSNDLAISPEVVYTDKISTKITEYIYDGNVNDFVRGTLEEVQQENFIIDRAKNIRQLDNQLIMSNIGGKVTDYCSLQKYASKIKSRVVVKEQLLTAMNVGSPKNPAIDLFSVGYMPGEIYSFGIVYIYSDGTKSPVYHIPGITEAYKNESLPEGRYHMSTDNTLTTTKYDRRDNCFNYWGVDAVGNKLEGTNVRHHRFPTRDELGIGFIYSKSNTETNQIKEQFVDVNITSYISKNLTGTNVPIGTQCNDEFTLKIKYDINGQTINFLEEVIVVLDCNYNSNRTFNLNTTETISNLVVEITSKAGNIIQKTVGEIYVKNIVETTQEQKFVKILGIEFTNITLPETTGELSVVGYEIVRQERDSSNKTILDTGVLTPILDTKNYAASGHIFPNFEVREYKGIDYFKKKIYYMLKGNIISSPVHKQYKGLISPEFLFNKSEYSYAKLIHVGNYKKKYVNKYDNWTEDVQPGTSYDPDIHKKKEKDLDGYSLATLVRVNGVEYESTPKKEIKAKDIFYLDALGSFMTQTNDKEIFNVSSDNKTGIIHLDNPMTSSEMDLKSLPYVILKRDLSNPYINFLTARYFKQQLNPSTFNSSGISTVSLYGGDSYLTPLKYTNTYFVDIHNRKRATKKSIWKIIGGALLAVAGVAAAIFLPTLGLALSAAAIAALTTTVATAAVQFGLSMVSSGIKQDKMIRVYNDLWNKGLKDVVLDADVLSQFSIKNPADDEIEWMSDVVEDLWFETNFNGSLRLDADVYEVTYIPPIRPLTEELANKYIRNKLTVTDPNQGGGYLYKGFATAEWYALNKDYDVLNHCKYHYPIPYEYDCCSTCRESFPHRIVYSQTSFSEELTDNFKKFLPNNYKDLSGETGPINNMFVQNNRLYLHTSEALWMQPNSYQERVTNEIVSFIGTGSLLESSAQKLIDDSTGKSAGIQHKWSASQFAYGYVFVSANEKNIYLFDGKFDIISDKGLNSWFNNNITDLRDSPYNYEGYITAYDPQKKRIIVTKNTGNEKTSWTVSYSLEYKAWISYHSYIPNIYITSGVNLYTWKKDLKYLWKHNIPNNYQTFYNIRYPHIIEYVSNISPAETKVWNALKIQTEVKEFNSVTKSYNISETETYNKIILYNSRQCSGELNLELKSTDEEDSMMSWIQDKKDDYITIARKEKDWFINDFRDYRIKYNEPIWRDINSYNKELNISTIDFNKDWTQLEYFRDKYLNIRLIFDKFADKKIIFNTSSEDIDVSKH